MKQPKDKFSRQSQYYKKFRPTYPNDLYDFILKHCNEREYAWDCGTGNGQVANVLASHFKKVEATDISNSQLNNSIQKRNISYSLQRAEKTSFLDNSFDLITVAQALHWFDFEAFNKEATRVLKPNGIIAAWGYDLSRINNEIDPYIRHFYSQTLQNYWDKERKFIDDHYESIPLYFSQIQIPQPFEIQLRWTLNQLEGYLNSWSAVENYKASNNTNPVGDLIYKLKPIWLNKKLEVRFPIF